MSTFQEGLRVLRAGQTVVNPLNGHKFKVGRFIGEGSSGAVYRVESAHIRIECCLKVTTDLSSWLHEAYFGDLFKDEHGVIKVYESFAWLRTRPGSSPLYCLLTEYAEHGDLAQFIRGNPQPWHETSARREITRLLSAVQCLHQSGAVHRDITPSNVFVTSGQMLKLGDFGIARHRHGNRHVPADAFSPWFAPQKMTWRPGITWKPADDVYQMGRLFALLLQGAVGDGLTTFEVKQLSCSPDAKAIIQRCIGSRAKRFPNAEKMLECLRQQRAGQEQAPNIRSKIRSLMGKRVVFTGRLKIRRTEAADLVRGVGGIVESAVTRATNVLIVGEQSPFWKAERKGQKLLDMDRQLELGRNVAVLSEKRFLALTQGRDILD